MHCKGNDLGVVMLKLKVNCKGRFSAGEAMRRQPRHSRSQDFFFLKRPIIRFQTITESLLANMATVLPPPSKRQKRVHLEQTQVQQEALTNEVPHDAGSIRVQFVDARTGEKDGGPVLIPLVTSNIKTLNQLANHIARKDIDEDDDEGDIPYKFTLVLPDSNQKLDITSNLYNALVAATGSASTEQIPIIQRTPQAVFKVRPVTRCSASIPGHGEAILAAQFSPVSSRRMCSGSGDNTARIWDCDTGTPFKTLKGHTSWVLVIAYSPDGSMVATGSHDKTVRLWDSESGKQLGKPMTGHSAFVRGIAWEPYHLQQEGRPRLASCSKDGSIRIWDALGGHIEHVLSGHKTSVSCVRWGGTGQIYTSGHDKTIKIWDSNKGTLIKSLTSHAHQVNHLALSTDAVLRTSYHDPQAKSKPPEDTAARRALAKARYEKAATVKGKITERLVSASDDNTIFLWDAFDSTKPIARLLGHQKQVNHVTFSSDGALIASCGFDNHVKLWSGVDGSFLYTMRAHVGPVYMAGFSADSRLLVSCSKDTTLKIWDVGTGKLKGDLPGHKDEVYAVDWAPDGGRVGSGGKDKVVKLWAH